MLRPARAAGRDLVRAPSPVHHLLHVYIHALCLHCVCLCRCVPQTGWLYPPRSPRRAAAGSTDRSTDCTPPAARLGRRLPPPSRPPIGTGTSSSAAAHVVAFPWTDGLPSRPTRMPVASPGAAAQNPRARLSTRPSARHGRRSGWRSGARRRRARRAGRPQSGAATRRPLRQRKGLRLRGKRTAVGPRVWGSGWRTTALPARRAARFSPSLGPRLSPLPLGPPSPPPPLRSHLRPHLRPPQRPLRLRPRDRGSSLRGDVAMRAVPVYHTVHGTVPVMFKREF